MNESFVFYAKSRKLCCVTRRLSPPPPGRTDDCALGGSAGGYSSESFVFVRISRNGCMGVADHEVPVLPVFPGTCWKNLTRKSGLLRLFYMQFVARWYWTTGNGHYLPMQKRGGGGTEIQQNHGTIKLLSRVRLLPINHLRSLLERAAGSSRINWSFNGKVRSSDLEINDPSRKKSKYTMISEKRTCYLTYLTPLGIVNRIFYQPKK